MPRPGPRPYECVRRAWHSDRHQPIRGSIIQQIFRKVTEAHSSTTRKNREWQEKLPRVVFKAEEIMYSKANSEAEYMDPETLWERLNDAVDTIIRRDESTETGPLLQPCIEAALVLGCVPVRASRSQRHSNPRSYLHPRFQDPVQPSPLTVDRTTDNGAPPQLRPLSSNQLTVPTCSTSPFNNQTITSSTGPRSLPSFPQSMPASGYETNNSLNFGSVYPLYYGNQCQNIEPLYGLRSPQNPNPNNIIIGTPVGWPTGLPSQLACTRNFLPAENTAIKVDTNVDADEEVCDLSLRLGPSDPSTSAGKGVAFVAEDGGSSSHWESRRFSKTCDENVELCFFPRHNDTDNPSEFCNNRIERESEFQDQDANLRKRKALDPQELEDGSVQWLTKLHHDQFDGHKRWPGL